VYTPQHVTFQEQFNGEAGAKGPLISLPNMAPIQKDRPLLTSKRRSHSKTHKWSWKEQRFCHESRRGPKPRMTVLARTNSNYCYGMPRTVVSSQSQRAETRESEDPIIEPLPSNGRLRDACLTALFRLSGVMSHVTCLYGTVTVVSSGSTMPAFRT
jgi:hypothetical protein